MMKRLRRTVCCFLPSLVLSLFLSLLRPSLGAHPFPQDRDLQRYHHRLKEGRSTSTSTSTSLVNPALCQGTARDKCRRLENDMLRNANKLQKITEKAGFIRILVLLMQFTDHQSRTLPDKSVYEELFNGQDFSDIIPTGSISQYIQYNSYNKLNVEAHVVPWMVTDNSELHYSFNRSGLLYEFHQSFYPLLDQLEYRGFNFSHFDQDDDGNIDSLVVLHSGYPAEIGGKDCTNNRTNERRIWAHALADDENNWRSSKTGKRVFGYCVASAFRGTCDANPARISVITHEYLHIFGLPDLNDGTDFIGRGLGDYDIMSNSHGKDGSQTMPSHLSAWSKMKLGWVRPKEIEYDGDYSIQPSAVVDDVYKISKNFPPGEYLLIENRQPLMWDKLLADGGILVWHIDETVNLNTRRGYPSFPGWPGNGDHYGIALLAADGKYDLEVGRNGGDDGDYWKDSMVLGPGLVESSATANGTYPNTNSYQYGYIQKTGITLHGFSASKFQMEFSVMGVSTDGTLAPVAPTSNPTPNPTPNPTSHPTPDPTPGPTPDPTPVPTPNPTPDPTPQPTTATPTVVESMEPSQLPTSSISPSDSPSFFPSTTPTHYPSGVPSHPTSLPSYMPSAEPSTALSSIPSMLPAVRDSMLPSTRPSSTPRAPPSLIYSESPSIDQSIRPSHQATDSLLPSAEAFSLPSFLPMVVSSSPSQSLSEVYPSSPSALPSLAESELPSTDPSMDPSRTPSPAPSSSFSPSESPTMAPSSVPSGSPTHRPSIAPSVSPNPSNDPSSFPSTLPTRTHSGVPSSQPSWVPTYVPSLSAFPSKSPSIVPSGGPSQGPSAQPSTFPTGSPMPSTSAHPSDSPSFSDMPSSSSASTDSIIPSVQPGPAMADFSLSDFWDQPVFLPSSYAPSDEPTHFPSSGRTSFPTISVTQMSRSPTQHSTPGYLTQYGLDVLSQRTRGPSVRKSQSPVQVPSDTTESWAPSTSDEPTKSPSPLSSHNIFSHLITQAPSSPSRSPSESGSPSLVVTQSNVFARPTPQSPITAALSQTGSPTTTPDLLEECYVAMALADGDNDSKVSKDEYPQFVNQLSSVGLGASFEDLPFVLRGSFERFGVDGELQEDDLETMCAKLHIATDLAIWGFELESSPDLKTFPECVAGMILSDKDDDSKLNLSEFEEYMELMSSGLSEVSEESVEVSFGALQGEDGLVDMKGFPVPEPQERENLQQVCDLTNAAIKAAAGGMNSTHYKV